MAKFSVEIEVPDGCSPVDLQILLRDAMSDFRVPRASPRKYVEKHYSEYSGERFERKVEEVSERVSWAYGFQVGAVRG